MSVRSFAPSNLAEVEKSNEIQEESENTEKLEIESLMKIEPDIEPKPSQPSQLVPCSAKDCPKVFDTVHQALRHIRDMHGQMEITRFRITNGPHWFIKCKECQYGFTAQKAYDTVC